MTTRYALSTAVRDGAVNLLREYGVSEALGLSVYRARPARLVLPHAFIDKVRDVVTYVGPTNYQRRVAVDVLVLHGLFDSGDAVDQRDRFVDGFFAWVAEHHDAAGPNTLISGISAVDIPVYRPDWFPEERTDTYFATLVTLEGYAET